MTNQRSAMLRIVTSCVMLALWAVVALASLLYAIMSLATDSEVPAIYTTWAFCLCECVCLMLYILSLVHPPLYPRAHLIRRLSWPAVLSVIFVTIVLVAILIYSNTLLPLRWKIYVVTFNVFGCVAFICIINTQVRLYYFSDRILRCYVCDYDLSQNVGDSCPECGAHSIPLVRRRPMALKSDVPPKS